MDWHDNWNIMVEFLVKSIRIRSFRREQLHPLGFFKLVTHKEGIVLCLHPLFNVTPIQGGKSNRCSCSHPQNARLPISLSSVGMTTSCSATQFRKTSLPICVSRGGSHIQFKATQWANVEERRAVISVLMRLTSTRLLQFSQARGPILWKSLGKQSCSMPAPQNAPSGSARGLFTSAKPQRLHVECQLPLLRARASAHPPCRDELQFGAAVVAGAQCEMPLAGVAVCEG